MMYGYWPGEWLMILMPLAWIVLIAAVAWAVVRLARPSAVTGPGGGTATALQILDRRYAAGEIDDATYARMRGRMSGTGTDPS